MKLYSKRVLATKGVSMGNWIVYMYRNTTFKFSSVACITKLTKGVFQILVR